MTSPATAYALLGCAVLLTVAGLVLAVTAVRRRRRGPGLPDGHEQGLFGLQLVSEHSEHTTAGDSQDKAEQDALDRELRVIVDDTATSLTGAPASNPQLGANPLTGAAHTRRRHDPRAANLDSAPVRRLLTTDQQHADLPGRAASSRALPLPDVPTPALPDEADLDVANTLATAFETGDLDTLAALARQVPQHAAAGHLLAAAVGVQRADPRFYGHLLAAWQTGQDPAHVPELAPFLDQLTFTVDVPDAHVLTTRACTRDGLALALAAAEYTITDSQAAHDILSTVDLADPVAALLAATVALDLNLPAQARQAMDGHREAVLAGTAPTRWAAALAAVAAHAELAAAGDPATATALVAAGTAALDGSRTDHDTTPAQPAATGSDEQPALSDEQLLRSAVRFDALEQDLQYLQALAAVACGNDAAAWPLLTALLHRNPAHRPARALLKTL